MGPTSRQCQGLSVQEKRHTGYEAPKWVWIAYAVIAVFWILDGALDIALGSGLFGNKYSSPVVLVLGAIGAAIGLGLLLRVELVRGIANILSWIKILGGVFGILNGLVFSAFLLGPLGLLLVLFSVIDVITGGLMVYLIAETEGQARI